MRAVLALRQWTSIVATVLGPMLSPGQVLLSGRVAHPRAADSTEPFYLPTILCFASLEGPRSEARAFRTWETDPPGWFRLAGSAGRYTLVFTHPAHFVRPVVLNNIFTREGESLDGWRIRPPFDYASFVETAWDAQPATHYYQTFVARGRGVTAVGFKLAHDGVDGAGPKAQNVVLSIHRRGDGTPDQWPSVGPPAWVSNVDCGGFKNYSWSAGWNSGEVPLVPGETYAVHLRPEAGGVLQAFWRTNQDQATRCYRLGATNAGWQWRNLWMAVASDGDGLLVPYNKKVHGQFKDFAGFARKWSQTYVAQGRSLASVVLYAAVGGTQPPLSRQRVVVRVLRGGSDGARVGLDKIAIGNGHYTGDASWGVFGTAFAPGEVPLVPGETYAIEFESIESYETLHGFVNIKQQISDERPGFNPYRKVAPDTYPAGTAFQHGTEAQPFDLDLQIIEYEFPSAHSTEAIDRQDWLRNGNMETAATESWPAHWQPFALESATQHARFLELPGRSNHCASILGGSSTGRRADGGYVQRADGLNRLDTYRLSGRVRCTWPVDWEHQCFVGYDPTGQTNDAREQSIHWTVLPSLHGEFVPYESDPIRPRTNAVSIWLRARTTMTNDYRFRADFDDFALRRVRTEVPAGPGDGRDLPGRAATMKER